MPRLPLWGMMTTMRPKTLIVLTAALCLPCAGAQAALLAPVHVPSLRVAGNLTSAPLWTASPAPLAGPLLTLSRPQASLTSPLPSPQVQPALEAGVRPLMDGRAASQVQHVSQGLDALLKDQPALADRSPAGSYEAGMALEDLVTGRASAPAAAEPAPLAQAAAPEELAFTARASADLAASAEDFGAENGLKFSRMNGQDFLDMLAQGQTRYALQNQGSAPSPRAFAAAAVVQTEVIRMVKALLKKDQPLMPQVSRLLSIWQVFNQEMAEAAQKGSLEAVEAEAKLFADQVEQSV